MQGVFTIFESGNQGEKEFTTEAQRTQRNLNVGVYDEEEEIKDDLFNTRTQERSSVVGNIGQWRVDNWRMEGSVGSDDHHDQAVEVRFQGGRPYFVPRELGLGGLQGLEVIITFRQGI